MIKPNTIHSVRGASLRICLMRKTSILSLGAGQQLCSAQSMGWWAPASPLHEQPALHHGYGKSAAFQGGVGSSCSEGQQEPRLISLDVTEKEGPDLWLIGGKTSLFHLWQPSPTYVWLGEHSGITAWLTAESGTELSVVLPVAPRGGLDLVRFWFCPGPQMNNTMTLLSPDPGTWCESHQGCWLALPWRAAGPLLLPNTGWLRCPKIFCVFVCAFLRNQALETTVFDLPLCLSKVLAPQGK